MALLVIALCALVIYVVFKLWSRPHNFPPGEWHCLAILKFEMHKTQVYVTSLFGMNHRQGPRGVPILGYAPLLEKKEPLFKLILNLAKQYGVVTGFYVGPTQPFICVVGPQAVKEALHNKDLDGRSCGGILLSRTFGKRLGAKKRNKFFYTNTFVICWLFCLFNCEVQVYCLLMETFGMSKGDLLSVICVTSALERHPSSMWWWTKLTIS